MFKKIIQNYSVTTTKASSILFEKNNNTKNLIKNHLNLKNINFKTYQQKTTKNERKIPNLIFLQNPYIWAKNKIDFKLLKYSWDKDFDENEFKNGAKTVSKLLLWVVVFTIKIIISIYIIWRCKPLKRFYLIFFKGCLCFNKFNKKSKSRPNFSNNNK